MGKLPFGLAGAGWLAGGVGLLLLGLRAAEFSFPPDADQTYYLILADNLASGRGFVEDFVWHYLRAEDELTHPSNDFWMPLTSLLLAPAALLAQDDFGDYALRTAPALLWSTAAIALFAALAGRVLASPLLGLAAGVAFALQPLVLFYGATSDSSMLYAALLIAALSLYEGAVQPRAPLARATLLGCLLGLATLTRSEFAATLPLTVVLLWLLARGSEMPRPTLRRLVVIGFCAALVVLPWVLRSLFAFGAPWNPASGAVGDAASPLGIYAFPLQATTATSDLPTTRPLLEALSSKAGVTAVLAMNFFLALGALAAPLVGLGAGLFLRERQPTGLAALAFVAALCLTYGLLADRLGFTPRTLTALIPPALLCAGRALTAGLAWLASATDRPALAKQGALAVCLLVLVAAGAGIVARVAQPRSEPTNAEAEVYASLDAYLSERGEPRNRPLMSVQPMQLYYGTGRPAVMAPSNGLDAIAAAAEHYGSELLLLNGLFLASPEYQELGRIYLGQRRDARFREIHQHGRWKLFRIQSSPPAGR